MQLSPGSRVGRMVRGILWASGAALCVACALGPGIDVPARGSDSDGGFNSDDDVAPGAGLDDSDGAPTEGSPDTPGEGAGGSGSDGSGGGPSAGGVGSGGMGSGGMGSGAGSGGAPGGAAGADG